MKKDELKTKLSSFYKLIMRKFVDQKLPENVRVYQQDTYQFNSELYKDNERTKVFRNLEVVLDTSGTNFTTHHYNRRSIGFRIGATYNYKKSDTRVVFVGWGKTANEKLTKHLRKKGYQVSNGHKRIWDESFSDNIRDKYQPVLLNKEFADVNTVLAEIEKFNRYRFTKAEYSIENLADIGSIDYLLICGSLNCPISKEEIEELIDSERDLIDVNAHNLIEEFTKLLELK